MDDIFKPHEECPQPRTVLIEGNPGIGKTTYCNKLAYDWATKELEQGEETSSGSSFPRFKVVLLLKCRDISEAIKEQRLSRTVKEKDEEFFNSVLWDAIDDQLLPRDVTKEEKENFYNFVRHNQSEVLLVLDGLDELPTSMLPAFKEIIQGRMLLKCHIVVTARHEVGMKMRECCDSLLSVEGFTPEDAQNFVVKYFGTRAELAQRLLNKLDLDGNLMQLTQSPLNTALLCLLCEDLNGIFPQSGTQLYLEIVECVLRRYRKKKGLPDTNCDDLIVVYKTQLKELGRIAWEGLLHGSLYFEKSKFENCADELPEYGFLSVERGRSKRRPCLYYCFLHKTFQELFAAFYLSCQVLDGEICPENLIADDRYFHELKQVLAFSCGLITLQSQKNINAVVAVIAGHVNNGHELLVALECLGECRNEQSCCLHVQLACKLGSLFYITQLDLSGYDLCLDECTTLAKVVKHNSTITQLDLSRNCLGYGDCTALAEAIKHHPTITQLNMSGNYLGRGDYTALAEAIKHNSKVTQLDLARNGLGYGDFTALAEAIKQNSTVTQLNLSCNCLAADHHSVLFEAIKENSTITQWNLSLNFLGFGDCTALAKAIKHNSAIAQLDLSGNGLDYDDCTELVEAINHNSAITLLNLSGNYLSDIDCAALAEAIKHHSTIINFEKIVQS